MVGRLMSNYTGGPVVTASQLVWAQQSGLATAAAVVRQRAAGVDLSPDNLTLAPALALDQWTEHHPRLPGQPPRPSQKIGTVLPPGGVFTPPTGPVVSTLPSVFSDAPRTPVDRPTRPLSPAAQRIWDASEWVPSGRSFYGRPAADERSALYARFILPVPGMFVVSVHGGPYGFGIGDDQADVDAMAETITASPGYHGQPLLLNFCNV